MGHIVKNIACPACREAGHDSTGNHAIVFSDGGVFCSRKHFHKDNKNYYASGEDGYDVSKHDINGEIHYTPAEFNELDSSGKLIEPLVRQLALSGMSKKDKWEVLNDKERESQSLEWTTEMQWFDTLKTSHLVDRGIHGLIAKLYGVKVGHDEKGSINRHYYPQYEEGVLMGASCRTLPKDFRFGHLGKRFGNQDLFGMNTMKQVADSGQLKKILIILGGQCDAMSAQMMIIKELNKLENLAGRSNLDGLKLFHIWSVNKGEAGIQELIDNKDQINQFKTVIWGFDNDEVGAALNKAASKLFRGKSKRLVYPSGTKDANDCLRGGRDSEFTTAVFNAVEPKVHGKLKRVKDCIKKARILVKMGKDYWLKGFNPITFGIRLYYMAVWGAGTGVGKTDTTVQHVDNLLQQGEEVVVIYLENTYDEVCRTFAGMLVGKDFNSPIQEQSELDEGFKYNPARDYTQRDLDDALAQLSEQDNLIIADLAGSKDVDSVMEVMEEALAMGYQYFVVDNLTAFEHHNEKGDKATGVQAIDETMKRLGTFKDENPVNIFLLSHLIKVNESSGRIPHVHGGEVYESDFRGAGSITFWANAVWAIERNTIANVFRNKCITLYRNIKNRGIGHMVGSTVVCEKDIHTGRYTELAGVHGLPEVGREKPKDEKQRQRNNFDDGSSRDRRSDPIKPSVGTESPELPDGEEF